jgi:signal transduction histidine kinase
LLDYARITTSNIALEQVDLDAVMTEAMDNVEDQVADRNAVVTMDPIMPIVRGSHPTLVMVMSNLLSNAIKFVDTNDAPRVNVRADRVDGNVRIWVEDNGIGISSDHAERVFDPFERLNGGRAFPGTGIGLAIVSAAISRMDGRVGVESEPGVGSRFWIELPRSW